jgi:uncharacterized protein YecT (DUF1311 family)
MRRAAILLALLIAGPAAAQTQLELSSKAADELVAAEAQMKAVYDRIARPYGADTKKRLQEAQDAWTIYRDKQCFFENKSTEDGTIHQMLVYQCRKALTDLRIAELKRQENCQEGDLSCNRE